MHKAANKTQFTIQSSDTTLTHATPLSFELKSALAEDIQGKIILQFKQLHKPQRLLGVEISLYFFNKPLLEKAIITDIETSKSQQNDIVILTIHSKLFLLKQSSHCQRFIEKSAKEILHEIFKNHPIQVKFKSNGPTKQYALLTQFEQTDADFYNQLLSDNGYWHYFSKNMLIITNTFSDNTDTTLTYLPQGFLSSDQPCIYSAKQIQRLCPEQISAYDYNPSLSETRPFAINTTTSSGFGQKTAFGRLMKTENDCEQLSQHMRRQLQNQSNITLVKTTDHNIELGQCLIINNHPLEQLNKRYRVIAIKHYYNQTGATNATTLSTNAYHNQITLLPEPATFCPTSNIHKQFGLQTGFIDATDKLELSKQSQYRFHMLYEEKASKHPLTDKATALAQKYAGMHLPLYENTEALIAFINGDINRPIILGALANKDSLNCVTSSNASQHIIQTKGGHLLLMNEGHSPALTLKHANQQQSLSVQAKPPKLTLENQIGDIEIVMQNQLKYHCEQNYTATCQADTYYMLNQHYQIQSLYGNIEIETEKRHFYNHSDKTLLMQSNDMLQFQANASLRLQATTAIKLQSEADLILHANCQLIATANTIALKNALKTQFYCGNSSITIDENGNIDIKTPCLTIHSDHFKTSRGRFFAN